MKQTSGFLLGQTAFKISLLYAIIGGAWMFFSDSLVRVMFQFSEIVILTKGFVFALVTACLLYVMIRRYEQQVQDRENQLLTLINALPDFITLKDGEGRWLEANTVALSLFELGGIQYKGKNNSELARLTPSFPDELLACEAADEATWKDGNLTRSEEVLRLFDGGMAIYDTIRVPIFHPDGSRKVIVVIGRDTTEHKKNTELLIKSEKLAVIGQLAAGVAHEIRNPLTALKGFVQLLSRREDNQPYCSVMLPELERVNQIVSEFLTIAKPQAQVLRTTSLFKLVQDVVLLLNTNAIEHSVELRMNCDSSIPVVNIDENQIKQVVMNIVKNAIEASPSGSRVMIHVQPFDANTVTIRVADNGSGISSELISKLGEPFFTTKEKGTGLGFLVSRRIIEAHRGRLLVSSEEGIGTTVDIVLPVSSAEEVSS